MPTAKSKAKDTAEETPAPSEVIDTEMELAELREKLLADMPPLRPAYRFRLAHRNAFTNLTLEAMKSGAFDGDGPMEFDPENAADIERLQKLSAFVESIDAWAETVADDPAAYAKWAEGKGVEHFMALYAEYRDALGESDSSVD